MKNLEILYNKYFSRITDDLINTGKGKIDGKYIFYDSIFLDTYNRFERLKLQGANVALSLLRLVKKTKKIENDAAILNKINLKELSNKKLN